MNYGRKSIRVVVDFADIVSARFLCAADVQFDARLVCKLRCGKVYRAASTVFVSRKFYNGVEIVVNHYKDVFLVRIALSNEGLAEQD